MQSSNVGCNKSSCCVCRKGDSDYGEEGPVNRVAGSIQQNPISRTPYVMQVLIFLLLYDHCSCCAALGIQLDNIAKF
jgi:hypothetical protein